MSPTDNVPSSDTPIVDEAVREAAALGEADDETAEPAVQEPAQEAAPAPLTPAKAAPAKSVPKGKAARTTPPKAKAQPSKAAPQAPAPVPAIETVAPAPESPVIPAPEAPRRLRPSLAQLRQPEPGSKAKTVSIDLDLPPLHELPAGGYCARHIDVRLEKADAEFVRKLAFNLEVATEGKVSPQKAVAMLITRIRELTEAKLRRNAPAA